MLQGPISALWNNTVLQLNIGCSINDTYITHIDGFGVSPGHERVVSELLKVVNVRRCACSHYSMLQARMHIRIVYRKATVYLQTVAGRYADASM